MKKIIFSIFLIAGSLFASGQYDQSIAVEGKYTPEYINHDRIGVFPTPLRFPLEKSSLQYSLSGTNADFLPTAVPIQATAWRAARTIPEYRGYLDLGIGSWLESTLSAGYRFIDSRTATLGIRLQHNSTSLWKPEFTVLPDTKTERYDESIGLYGKRLFGDIGRLEGAVDYHIGNFNYYGFDPYFQLPDLTGDPKAPTQTLNDIAARIGWFSPASAEKLSWSVTAGVRYFGYRRFYTPAFAALYNSQTGGRETDFNIKGGVEYKFASPSSLGIDVNADILSYAKSEWKGPEGLSGMLSDLDSYGMVSLTPYYKFTRNLLNIQIGVRIDLAFNAGPEDDRFSTFHIAPAVRLDYNAGAVKLFLHALGGTQLHTLASGYQQDYYQAPALTSTSPVYTPVDAKIGAAFGPFNGFHAGLDVAYRSSRNQYLGGYYQLYLNRELPYAGIRTDLNGFSFGINAGYDAGRFFKIAGEARYQPQDGETGYFNGYDRPEWTAQISAETNPWSSLRFKLGYELRAMRLMDMGRLPNVSLLNFGASYGITDRLSVWLQADNLLNRKYWYMPGLPAPGILISAGIGLMF